MAFGAIGLSEDSTGEFCRSLFKVVLISLSLSWVTAVTITPLLCVMFLRTPAPQPGERGDPYGGRFYGLYRGFLRRCIRFRGATVAVVLAGWYLVRRYPGIWGRLTSGGAGAT